MSLYSIFNQNDRLLDYSSTNYFVESYIFTSWFNSIDFARCPVYETDAESPQYGEIIDWTSAGNTFSISSGNNPDPEVPGSDDSDFTRHKKEVIKRIIEFNLNQSITSYSSHTPNADFYMPKLTELEWDQILQNASIITFLQNVPIGLKYYNNYAIATSTVNKEYVDPDEIYLNASDGDSSYYHARDCSRLGTSNVIGYRSIDYVQKSYYPDARNTANIEYYFKHHANAVTHIDVREACYYCLVQKSLFSENITPQEERGYYTALARERYIARLAILPKEAPTVAAVVVHPMLTTTSPPTPLDDAYYSVTARRSGYRGGSCRKRK